jgi:hypothetical protein
LVDLQASINRFIAETNDKPKPFVWTKSADAILAAAQRGRQTLESIPLMDWPSHERKDCDDYRRDGARTALISPNFCWREGASFHA